jgi:SAM-dependent methyltransferase
MNELGFQVSAVDASQAMVESAKQNVSDALVESDVSWHVGDLQTLPFPDNSFDFCACRNVTWLMRDPEAAYAEWLRVLKPGGTLAVYDANWYRYLVDEGVRRQREADMRENVLEGWDDDAQATSDEEKRCEELAAELPMTYAVRPAWDVEALTRLGVSRCSADELAWQKVWSENEQRYYAATPTFLVEAVK